MALNKDILGTAINTVRVAFSSKTTPQLIAEYGSIANAQLAMAKAEAEQIILHFQASAVVTVTVNTTGTALAQIGGGNGTIA
jgi:hypothetical protein